MPENQQPALEECLEEACRILQKRMIRVTHNEKHWFATKVMHEEQAFLFDSLYMRS
jgi:hypothetical protein